MADAIFEQPRLVEIYDAFDGPRDDLDHYLQIAEQLHAHTVVDLGCGTGNFCRMVARSGRHAIGIDPAAASIAHAEETTRTQQSGEPPRVEWLRGTSADIPGMGADLVTMTGNVAQVFLGVDELRSVFADCARGLSSGGHLVFETRDPGAEAWRTWAERGAHTLMVDGVGEVTETFVLGQVDLPFVSFTHLYRFHETGETIGSRSRLRFHSRQEITSVLEDAGFMLREVREAPDRPGLEWVVIAQKA